MEPRTLVEQIASLGESVQVALAVFVKVIERKVELEDGQGLMRREAELEAAAKQFLAKVLEGEVQAALDSEAMEARRRELLRCWPKQLKARGVRPVRIRTGVDPLSWTPDDLRGSVWKWVRRGNRIRRNFGSRWWS